MRNNKKWRNDGTSDKKRPKKDYRHKEMAMEREILVTKDDNKQSDWKQWNKQHVRRILNQHPVYGCKFRLPVQAEGSMTPWRVGMGFGVWGLGLGLGQNRSIDPRLWKVNSPLFAELWHPGAKAYVKVFRTLGGTLEAISAAWSEYVLIGQDWLAFGATRVSWKCVEANMCDTCDLQ